MSKIKFSRNMRTSKNGNRILLSNVESGTSVLVSEECYDILCQLYLAQDKEESLFCEAFEDADDAKYFQDLLQVLKDTRIIVPYDDAEARIIDSINIELTHRCNLSCRHCSASAGSISDSEVLSTEQLTLLLDRIIALHPQNICITGGEPLVRKDIHTVLEHLHSNYDGKLSIMTNATLITEANVKVLSQYFDAWDISIDGVSEETCAPIRGRGVFTKVIDSVRLLQKNGVSRISLSMVETAYTQKYIRDFHRLNEELGTYPMVRAYEEEGRGATNADDLRPEAVSSSFEELMEIAKQIGATRCERGECFHCGAGTVEFFVNHKGELFPCAPLNDPRFKICNILDIPDFPAYIRSEVYTSSEGFQNLQAYMPDRFVLCKDCPDNTYCWSCVHDLFVAQQDREAFAQRCALHKEELKYLWK